MSDENPRQVDEVKVSKVYQGLEGYNPTTDTWTTTTTTSAPVARVFHRIIYTGSKVMVWGGYNLGATEYNSGGLYG